MFANNKKISVRQLCSLLMLYVFGTAILFLPSELSAGSGNASWLVALFWCGLSCVTLWLLATLGEKEPTFSATDWYTFAFGNVLGKALACLLLAKLLLDATLELRIFIEIISASLLPKTPFWALFTAFLLLCGYTAWQGLECVARLGEILFFFVIVPIAILLFGLAVTCEYGRVLPIAIPRTNELVQGGTFFSVLFQGFSVLLFAFPHTQPKRNEPLRKKIVLTGLLASVMVVLLVFFALATFGADILSKKLLPTMDILERVSFSGIFLSRHDLLLLWFWAVTSFLFLATMLFFASKTFSYVFVAKQKKISFFIPLLLVWVGATLPENLTSAYRLRLTLAPWLQVLFLVVLPLLLVLIHRKKEGRR